MKLVITTPTAVAVEQEGVTYVRAEDRTGSFGIERGHADFLTVLAISVLLWRDAEARERYVAVRGGVLRVSGGSLIEVATREAVAGDDLGRLRADVLAQLARNLENERSARRGALTLERAAIRQLYRYLRPQARTAAPRLREGE